MQYRLLLTAVLAWLLGGCGGGGGPDSGSPPGNTTVPATPAGVAITVQPSSITVHWADVAGASSFNVYYADQPGVDTQSPRISVTAGPATVTGLNRGTTYHVRVSAANAAGESPLSPEQQARTTAPPSAVQAVTASPADGGAIVSWEAVSDADRYTVFASAVSGDVSGADSVRTTLTSVSIEGLSNGVTYYVSVRAENIEGDAPLSPETTVTPMAGGAGLGWSQQTLINEPYDFFGRDNYLGGVAVNDAGTAAATWIFDGSIDGNSFVIANHTASGSWGLEELVADGDNSSPTVAVTPSGVIVVAWIRHYLDASNFRTGSTVESRRYAAGAWTPIEQIADIPAGSGSYAGAIALAADGEDNVVAAWWQDQSTMWVNRFDGNAWGAAQQIGQSVRLLYPPAVGAGAADDAIVAWLQDTEPFDPGRSGGGPSRPVVYASEFDGSSWSASAPVGHTDLVGFDSAERVRIDVNPLGSAVVAWQQTRDNSAGTGYRIDALRFDAMTATWTSPETLVARDWQTSWPDVAIDANGNAIASWQPTDLADSSSTRVLDASLFDVGNGTWGPPQTVNTDDGVTEPSPLLVEMREAGDVFAVWQQTDGVFWRRYDATTQAWDAIAKLGVQDGAAIAMAMSRNGHTVVVTNPLVFANNSFEHAVYALLYRP